MDWARERANDPTHRDEIQALMTEIDVRQDLIALREATGLTQAQLAERSAYVSRSSRSWRAVAPGT